MQHIEKEKMVDRVRIESLTDSFLEDQHCPSWEVERPTTVSLIFSIRQKKQLYFEGSEI